MTQNDYKIIDMPTLLSREVKIQSPYDKMEWITDHNWYLQVRSIYQNFLNFLLENDLLKKSIDASYSDNLILFYSDLNEDGKAFIRSGADERWLDRFDKPGVRHSPSDTSILEKALQKIQRNKPR